MEDCYNNGFWDDICEEDGCFEIASKLLIDKVYCSGHWAINAAKIGITEDGPVQTDADKIIAHAMGIIF